MKLSVLSLLLAITTTSLGSPLPEPDAKTSSNVLEKRAILPTFVGTNAYWLAFLTSDTDVNRAFDAMKAANLKVVRTWAFNDAMNCNGVYFQCWNGNTPTINTGSNGLQRLDTVVRAAERTGVKLVLPMVNYWGDYGGMQVYIDRMGGGGKQVFYTNTNIKNAYKAYVAAVVNRYKNSNAIFSWQLANEPRCPGCSTSIITNWASEMSQYIKSLDSSHYVSLGDEGFFARGGSYPYQGGEGVDFDANLKIPTLDYGTFHMYSSAWGQTYDWGNQWIRDHAAAGQAAGKSVVLEEYGVPEKGYNRDQWMNSWHNTIRSSNIAGDQYWQFGLQLSYGRTHDDTYTIYNDDGNFNTLVTQWAASRNAN